MRIQNDAVHGTAAETETTTDASGSAAGSGASETGAGSRSIKEMVMSAPEQAITETEKKKTVAVKDILERQKEISDKISTQVRTIALGVLALTWGTVTSDSPVAREITASFLPPFLGAGLFAVLALIFDFAQYVCSFHVARDAYLNRDRKTNLGDYDEESEFFKWQYRLFRAKQVSTALAVFITLLTLFAYFVLRLLHM